jgi:hypothetical protein
MPLQLPRRISLRSINFRDRLLRHKNFLAELEPIVSELDKADATFIMTAALNGQPPDFVSFASVNFPGMWLRHQDFRLKLDKEPVRVDEFGPHPLPPDTPELKKFQADASFFLERMTDDDPPGISNRTRFFTIQEFFAPQIGPAARAVLPMRHRDFHVFMEMPTEAEPDADTQWEVVDGLLPAPPVDPH